MDDDVLALLALGEDAATDDERHHVETCARCADELAGLRDVAGLARDARDDVPLVAPPAHVWERVAAELGLGAQAAQAAGVPAGSVVTAEPPRVTTLPPAPAPATPPSSGGGDAGGDVVPLGPRRRTRGPWTWVAAAAAVGVVVGGVGTWAATGDAVTTDVVASATLDALPGWDASGTATVEVDADGTRVLVVDVEGPVDGDSGFREVWLLKPDVSGLVSLGTLAGASGRFDLPPGLDLDEFSVVDVSEEPFDGDPAHSGDSIVRGPLSA
ncbi:anti-sigma factor [Cellulomonas fimi]|uniref:anti-sigma factor n=1 Tax=Cellulomonas fimi TaxID=1708 RepID=UPI0002F10279|nr:anti-sigma factor [Cellulomonas fimi]